MVTGYSLIDWINNDPSVPPRAKTQSELDSLYGDHWLRLCGDIATAAKHFELLSRKPITSEVTSAQGYGLGRYGRGTYGMGEEQITIKLHDSTTYSASEVIAGVRSAWFGFFGKHRLEF